MFVALVFLGTALRAGALSNARCLWIDEAMLALNVLSRTPLELMRPLDWNQGAPLGFLLLVKAAVTQFGTGEVSLRLIPFAASLLGMAAFAWLATRLLPQQAAVLAVALLAVSPTLISYAAECKQYAVDASVTVGLFACAAGLLRGEGGAWRWGVLSLAGAAAVWLSHPAAFVLGGIGTGLLFGTDFGQNRGRLLATSATIACWLASFAVCYAISLRQLGDNQHLLQCWAGHFLPFPPKRLRDIAWVVDRGFTFFNSPGGLGGSIVRADGLAAVLFAVGVCTLWRECRPVAVALVVPGVLALLASGLHKYPFEGRLLLFLVPLALLGVARGAWTIAEGLCARLPDAALVVLGVLVAAPALNTYGELRCPSRLEQLSPVLDHVRVRWRPGDRMYVYYGAIPAYRYYTRESGFPVDAVTFGRESRENPADYRSQIATLEGHPRVWFVFSHRHRQEEDQIRASAETMGSCTDAITAAGAAAYLFDFTAPPAPVTPPSPGAAAPVAHGRTGQPHGHDHDPVSSGR